jgi:hypothetical protein
MIGARSNQLVIESGMGPIIDLAALAISASIAVVSAYEAFFDHRWLWIKYTNTLSQLYAISDDLDFIVAGASLPTDEELEKLHIRRQSILKETGAAWYDKRAQDATQPTLSA